MGEIVFSTNAVTTLDVHIPKKKKKSLDVDFTGLIKN